MSDVLDTSGVVRINLMPPTSPAGSPIDWIGARAGGGCEIGVMLTASQTDELIAEWNETIAAAARVGINLATPMFRFFVSEVYAIRAQEAGGLAP